MTERTDSIYVALPGERYTPFSLAKKLGAKAIFESASFAHGRSRYSTLMVDEGFRLRQNEKDVSIVVDGKESVFLKEGEGDILDALLKISAENTVPPNQIPIPSSGVGYLGYEFCARCDTIRLAPQVDELNIPEAEFLIAPMTLFKVISTRRINGVLNVTLKTVKSSRKAKALIL